MAQPQKINGDTDQVNAAAEFSQALKEIARGEQTAAALENHLDALEKKINDLLASAEENHQISKDKTEQSEENGSDKPESSGIDASQEDETSA